MTTPRAMMDDPRVHAYRNALAETNKGLSAKQGAHELYRRSIAPYIECMAEHTPAGIARRAMIAVLVREGFPLAVVAATFKATEAEVNFAIDQPPIQDEPVDEIERLRNLPYGAYLRTPHWQQVRQAALARAEHRCSLCNATQGLEVHHREYTRKGCERPADVSVLCSLCHERHHGHLRAA